MYQHINYEVKDGLASITMNRPEVYNALNQLIKEELLQAFTEAEQDAQVRVVVLSGSEKAFSAGQDLKSAQVEMQGKTYSETVRSYYNPLIMKMKGMPKPIIAKVRGVAAGAGCSLALACDVLVAAESATFTELFVGIGLVMDSGSTYFLPRMVGSLKAFELATLGTRLNATEAHELGLVNKVVPDQSLDESVMSYVQQYRHAPTRTVGLIKQMLLQSANMSLADTLELEAKVQDEAAATADHQEGIRAFMEKRRPVFQGK